jgi:hypothetical protein
MEFSQLILPFQMCFQVVRPIISQHWSVKCELTLGKSRQLGRVAGAGKVMDTLYLQLKYAEKPDLWMVEPRGFEPLTFSLRTRRSTN